MSRSSKISPRKQPQQARSEELVAVILQAATQVLAREGVQRFTTARVAERAGVSIGSLYQYFPNKAAILFRLQCDEWSENIRQIRAVLEDPERPPLERLRRHVHLFLHSECAEAEMRIGLADAAPLYRDSPEARAIKATGAGIRDRFMCAALPDVDPVRRALAGDMVMSTISAACKRYSEQPHTDQEIDAWAEALADMVCGYLSAIASG